jgi:hypothetical protein
VEHRAFFFGSSYLDGHNEGIRRFEPLCSPFMVHFSAEECSRHTITCFMQIMNNNVGTFCTNMALIWKTGTVFPTGTEPNECVAEMLID